MSHILSDTSGGLSSSDPAPVNSDLTDSDLTVETDIDARLSAMEANINKLMGLVANNPTAPLLIPPGLPSTVDAPTTAGPVPSTGVSSPVAGTLPVIPEQHPTEALPAPLVAVPEGEQHPSEAPAQTIDSGAVSATVDTSGSGVMTTSEISDDEAAETLAANEWTKSEADKDATIARLEAELAAMRSTAP